MMTMPHCGSPVSSVTSSERRRSSHYCGTPFENVSCKGASIYIRLPSPTGGRVRRRTSCATPRQAATLLDRLDALVLSDAEPLWWPIIAVLDRRVSLERLAHFLDIRTGGLAALEALVRVAPNSATPMMAVIDEYASLDVHDARQPGAVLHPRTVAQYVGYMRAAARVMPTLSDCADFGDSDHVFRSKSISRFGPCRSPSSVDVDQG